VKGAFALLALALAARPAAAQRFSLDVGRLFDDDGWMSYRLGFDRPLLGPLGTRLYGTALTGPAAVDQRLWGVGADVTLFRNGAGPYLAGGFSGGISTGVRDRLWGSWSAGAGYQLALAPWASVTGEGRWRGLSLDRRDGVEVAFGLAFRFGGRRSTQNSPSAPPAGNSTLPPLGAVAVVDSATLGGTVPLALNDAVVRTASQEMGRRYQLGGRGDGDDGFDCSGLIQYAYAKHGIQLPRRSVDQAREGRPVEKLVDSLRPGDILIFSNNGRQVTHVGLYVGGGRFIHSATRGVQESLLSPDDPYGRWWYRRWVGARRVVE
jgi:hypothetical protein